MMLASTFVVTRTLGAHSHAVNTDIFATNSGPGRHEPPGGTAVSPESGGCSRRLARRAPECDPVLLPLGPDGGAAPPTRTAPPAVDPGFFAPAWVAGGDLADSLLVRVEQSARQLRHGTEIRDAGRRAATG